MLNNAVNIKCASADFSHGNVYLTRDNWKFIFIKISSLCCMIQNIKSNNLGELLFNVSTC